jgi:ribosomal protein S18 acetylase RimI-like enzyme
MSAVRVRIATAADAPALRALIAAFRDHLGETDPKVATLDASLERLLADPDTAFAIAFDRGEEPAGYAQLRFRYSLWISGIEAHVDDFFVAAPARRRGVGRALLRESIACASARGARLLALTTNERNEAALALYRAAGFAAEKARWSGGRQLWLELPLAEAR